MSTVARKIYIGNVVQEAYDKYLELKLKEFKHVTKVLTCSHHIPAEAKQTVIEAIRASSLVLHSSGPCFIPALACLAI